MKKRKRNHKQHSKSVVTKVSNREIVFWIGLLIITFFYFKYKHPRQKVKDAEQWWSQTYTSFFEKQDIALPPFMYKREVKSDEKNIHSIFWNGNISNIDSDSTLQVFSSGDNYPNGRKDIPFKENKAVYSEDSALLPMYWCSPCPAWLEIHFPIQEVIDRVEVTPNTDVYGAGEYEILVWDNRTMAYIPTNPPSRYNGRAGKFSAFTFDKITTNKVQISVTQGGTGNANAYIKDIKIFTAKDTF